MGVKGLSKFLTSLQLQTTLNIKESIDIKNLGIDTSLFMHKFCYVLSSNNSEIESSKVINCFEKQHLRFKKWGINSHYIFDNKSSDLKNDTISKRKETNKQVVCYSFYTDLTNYFKENNIDFTLSPIGYEAEQYASILIENKTIDAVLTDDLDSLAFGCNKVITKLKPSGECIMYDLNMILENLKINKEQFILMCIMSGTDFNQKGLYKYGPSKSHKYLLKNDICNVKNFLTENIDNFEEINDLFHLKLKIND
jgi:5'-3' exonuclease